MNVVFLSPHFPPQMYLYCQRLRDLGATVLGIADAPWESLRPELQRSLSEYFRVPDLHNIDGLLRACGYFIHRHGRIDRVESLNEYWLETDARLRSEFNVPGLRAETIDRIKRKSAMKRVFQKTGVLCAEGQVIRGARGSHGAAVARHFVERVGFPIIAKPDIGVGAARTYRLENATDLEAFLGDRAPIDYYLEEFLDGTLLSYDGLVDRRGEVVFAVSLVYGLTVLDSVRGADMTYWIDRDIAPDLDALGRTLLRAFGVRERPFHFEFFRLPDGQLAVLEVNMRQPGGLTVDMWNWSFDIDFYRAWAEVVVNGTTTVKPGRSNYTLWAGRKTGKTYRLGHDDVLRQFAGQMVHHERMDDVFSTAIGNYGYILRGPKLEPLQAAAREILAIA
jgi:hypothetical protein